jgi:hypothetical protein
MRVHQPGDDEQARADHDFDLAPRRLQVWAGAAEALRRTWLRLPPPGKALVWMAVWGVAGLLGLPGPTTMRDGVLEVADALRHLGW